MSRVPRRNLDRLFRPRSIALIGGRDCETVAGELARIGFAGTVHGVNPNRTTLGGHPCVPCIEDLPEPPDAAFVAVPREMAIEAVATLSRKDAGGAVVYTAGFGEAGADGSAAQARLVEAAGDLALVGPNCYGVLDPRSRAALWPFAQDVSPPAGRGAAVVTQSGMLSSDLVMADRSLPLAAMVSAGNQAVLSLEDFVAYFAEDPGVAAIGLHIEGLKDVPAFEAAVNRARKRQVPVVALKTGSSVQGRRLTVSHTGSLSGEDDLYNALFSRLGVIRVDGPAALLETLKLAVIAGLPAGPRLAGFTCSGAGATMLADRAERVGAVFDDPGCEDAATLRALLPAVATVSNPLDYTTPIWGDAERTEPVFRAALASAPDAAILVQDYPRPGLDESRGSYEADAGAFIRATRAAGIPAAICATVPENLDRRTRDWLAAEGVAPLQGINEAVDALAAGARTRTRWREVEERGLPALVAGAIPHNAVWLDEATAKALLARSGVTVPDGSVVAGDDADSAAGRIGYPVAVKLSDAGVLHKTEAGAVRLGLSTPKAVAGAVAQIRLAVGSGSADRFLVERMAPKPVAELLVGLRRDAQFGLVLTLAAGGILTELTGDAATVLLPAPDADIDAALGQLRVARILDGWRGSPAGDRRAAVDTVACLARLMCDRPEIAEIEINPLFVLPTGVVAVDALVRATLPLSA